MIETVEISANPVTQWETFNLDLGYQAARVGFDRIEVEEHAGGHFWATSVNLYGERGLLDEMFSNGLGRDVRAKNEHGDLDFEGYINGMRLHGVGEKILTRSLESVYNRCVVRYKDASSTFQRSAVANDLLSQARFGIKEYVISGGQIQSATQADSLATRFVRARAWPKKVPSQLRLGKMEQDILPRIELECKGYIHTLDWRLYNQTASTGAQSADLEIADILSAVGQFIASWKLTPNNIGVTKEYDADRTAMDIIMNGIVALGDIFDERWVGYLEEGRVFVYEPAAPALLISL